MGAQAPAFTALLSIPGPTSCRAFAAPCPPLTQFHHIGLYYIFCFHGRSGSCLHCAFYLLCSRRKIASRYVFSSGWCRRRRCRHITGGRRHVQRCWNVRVRKHCRLLNNRTIRYIIACLHIR